MVDKIKDVKRGDLVELALTENAKILLGGAQPIFLKDKTGETDLPGRTYPGYVTKVESDSIFLAQGWNQLNNRIPDNIGATQFYFDAIASYSKVREDRLHSY